MQHEVEMARHLLQIRIAQSTDVCSTFDNCFFHCYGTYLLANKQPLPDDLFTFQSILENRSRAAQLQALFPDTKSLSVFDDYERLNSPDKEPRSPNHIVEKSIVLGLLMREWFATQLLKNIGNRDTMLQGDNGIITTFKAYKEFRAFSPKEDLLSGPEGTKYQPSEKFLEYFTARPIRGRDLTAEEQRFEKYFTDADVDPANHNADMKLAAAISTYWQTEGYEAYCKFLAKPQVKLAYNDVVPVLKELNQPFAIYDNHGRILSAHKSKPDTPPFEISLFAAAGHYHLLKTEQTKDILDEYKVSFDQYKLERTALLTYEGDQSAEALRKESLLVGAICISGQLPQEPFDFLVDRVTHFKKFVADSSKDVVIDTPKEPDLIPLLMPEIIPNFSFLLKAGAYLSTAVSMASFIIATLAMLAFVTMATVTVGTTLGLGLAAGAGAFGLFKAAQKDPQEETQLIYSGPQA